MKRFNYIHKDVKIGSFAYEACMDELMDLTTLLKNMNIISSIGLEKSIVKIEGMYSLYRMGMSFL